MPSSLLQQDIRRQNPGKAENIKATLDCRSQMLIGMMQKLMQNGQANVCLLNRNGKSQHPAKIICSIHGVMNGLTKMPIQERQAQIVHFLPAIFLPDAALLVFMICAAMYGNGPDPSLNPILAAEVLKYRIL